MEYRIYCADKLLLLTTDEHAEAEQHIRFENIPPQAKVVDFFETCNTTAIICTDLEQVMEWVRTQLYPVVAAGGVVSNVRDEILLINRFQRWDLPKGHLEEGENLAECALREVEEECNLGNLELVRPICQTLHCYYMHNRWELKTTHWYAMHCHDTTQQLKPQTEEGIEAVEWFPKAQIEELTRGSFPTIREVFGKY